MRLSDDQLNLLLELVGSKVVEPMVANFCKLEQGDTVGQLYARDQHWRTSTYDYHSELNGYRGVKPIFSFTEMNCETTAVISKLIASIDCLSSTTHELVEPWVDWLFQTLAPYDQQLIRPYGQDVPHQILLLKFLRELLCNPFIAKYLFDAKYHAFIRAMVTLLGPILATRASTPSHSFGVKWMGESSPIGNRQSGNATP